MKWLDAVEKDVEQLERSLDVKDVKYGCTLPSAVHKCMEDRRFVLCEPSFLSRATRCTAHFSDRHMQPPPPDKLE